MFEIESCECIIALLVFTVGGDGGGDTRGLGGNHLESGDLIFSFMLMMHRALYLPEVTNHDITGGGWLLQSQHPPSMAEGSPLKPAYFSVASKE